MFIKGTCSPLQYYRTVEMTAVLTRHFLVLIDADYFFIIMTYPISFVSADSMIRVLNDDSIQPPTLVGSSKIADERDVGAFRWKRNNDLLILSNVIDDLLK